MTFLFYRYKVVDEGCILLLLRDRLQIFVSYPFMESVVLYDIDTIFYKPHTN